VSFFFPNIFKYIPLTFCTDALQTDLYCAIVSETHVLSTVDFQNQGLMGDVADKGRGLDRIAIVKRSRNRQTNKQANQQIKNSERVKRVLVSPFRGCGMFKEGRVGISG